MTPVRRLQAVSTVLTLAAIMTCSHAWGEPASKTGKTFPSTSRPEAAPAKTDANVLDDLANTKFAHQSLVIYQTHVGETLFAYQLQPKIVAGPARPLDLVLLVDTAASQGRNGALATARQLTEDLAKALKPGDRVAIVTVNTPNTTLNLTRGLEAAQSPKVADALKVLAQEVPYGANDLKAAIAKALASFDQRDGRQRAIVLFGSGKSLLNPITHPERHELCAQFVAKEIAFFSVPLGANLEAVNLHGLATGTGGRVIRVLPDAQNANTVKALAEAVAAPILYTSKLQLPAEEIYPTKLPPVRSDVATLVVGKIKPAAKFNGSIEGTVAGKKVALALTQDVPAAEVDNFFLVKILNEWKNAEQRERPWPFQANRALVLAYERARLVRDEFKAQGDWAIEKDRLDVAGQMFAEARKIDPNDPEADAGLKIVEKMKQGLLTKERLRDALGKPEDAGIRFQKGAKPNRDRMDKMVAFAQAEDKMEAPEPKLPKADPNLPVDREPLLRLQQQRQAVEEQRITGIVNQAERQALQILVNDPESAHDILKRTLASVRDNNDLSPQTRQALLNRLENRLRDVDTRAVRIKRDLDERMRNEAAARERLAGVEARERADEQLARRVQAFNQLMNTGRYEEAQLAALQLQADRIAQGLPVGPVETATFAMGINSVHIKEQQEIRRATEERSLLTLLQVDKSHIPFPDEPPVGFPPASIWRKLTDRRKGLYESVGLGEDAAGRTNAEKLKSKLSQPVTLDKGIDPNTPLKDALEFLADKYDLTLIIDTRAFEAIGVQKVEEQPVQLPKMVGVSMATVLRLLLAQVKGDVYFGTYMVRRDFIEITTTYNAAAEKVVRAFPVADLVISIPNSINQSALNQSLQTFGQFQNAAPPPVFPGAGFPGMPAFPGQPVPGGLGGGNPQFNGIGNNQFGNLGGQFGLQGMDTSRKLMELIVKVVAPGEWMPLGFDPNSGMPPPGGMPLGALDPLSMEPIVPREMLNSIDYYETARALVVRGSSRLHARLEGGVLSGAKGGPPVMAGAGFQRNGAVVIGGKDKNDPANTGKGDKPVVKPNPTAVAKAEIDAKKVWEEALAEMVKNPKMDHAGRVIACADFLVEHKKFNHAVEFLKAELRLGIVARPWVYEALAVALQLSGGSPDEIERAQVSAVDLEPQDAKGYLRAAKAMAELKRPAQAVAFCRQAALMEPNVADSYANALVYAQDLKDDQAMAWAARNLLRQDWASDNDELHHKAKAKVDDLIGQLEHQARQGDAERLRTTVAQVKERDLVIKLTWDGAADFDLKVKEPVVGSVCSYLNRQTPGGGTLLSDDLAKLTQKQYVAAEGFTGDYEITVERVWGRPVGARVTLEVVRHQGTARQRVEYHTVYFDKANTLKVALADGRRTSMASVPAPAAVKEPEREGKASNPDQVLNKLRMLSDSGMIEMSGLKGGMSGTGAARTPARSSNTVAAAAPAGDPRQATYQKVQSFVNNAVDVAAQTTMVPERGEMRVKFNPVFPTNGKGATAAPLIPGGF